jgi:hypothetical protein
MHKRPSPARSISSDADAPRLGDRLFWLCVPIGIIAAIVLLLLFDLSWWSAVGIALLIACPMIVAWALFAERGLPGPRGSK